MGSFEPFLVPQLTCPVSDACFPRPFSASDFSQPEFLVCV